MSDHGNFKFFKDPVYGYIEVSRDIVTNIIDTPCFQRLRRIRQTGYSPVYPSSLHNRFVHSLGVYFLGKHAIAALEENCPNDKEIIREQRNTFLRACLLHDVGHAPFSHSGEEFLDIEADQKVIHNFLESPKFREDYGNIGSNMANHEITSVRIALENYKGHIQYKEFFARCILGIPYISTKDRVELLRNCLISLLHSALIDIDRLDYIIRDAATAGYQSTGIDFVRLFRGLVIEHDSDNITRLVYTKHALSVIENVLIAHDAEKKWIQNHPVITYEHFLAQYAIARFIEYHGNNLFSSHIFSPEGASFGDRGTVRLLADEDILYTVKNLYRDSLTDELFDRKMWRHPLWKSEAEYRLFFGRKLGETALNRLEEYFQLLTRFIKEHYNQPPVIDNQLLSACEKMRETYGQYPKGSGYLNSNEIDKVYLLLTALKNFNPKQFNYVIIKVNMFNSNFIKMENIRDMKVYFPMVKEFAPINTVASVLKAEKERENFYYLFYKREEGKKTSGQEMANHLCRELIFK